MQLDRYPWWFLTKCMKVCLPAGSGDRSSATPSQAAPQNRGWCGSNRPAWAWPRTWAGLCGPNRRYSAPPLRFSQTPPCLRSAVLLPWSATNPHTPFNITMLLSFFTLYFPFYFFFFYSFVIAISGTRISFRIHKSSIESYLTYNNLVNRLRILIHLLVHSRSNALLSSPWCAQASVWTPDWRASGSPRCWGRPHPSACGVTLSSHGCCEYPRTPAQHFDRHPHFHNHHPSSEEEKTKTSQVRVEKVVFLFFFFLKYSCC